MTNEREWYLLAEAAGEAAGFVFLRLPTMREFPPPGGKDDPPMWTEPDSERAGKYRMAAAALAWRDEAGREGSEAPRNLAVGVEKGKRGVIVDANDASAVAAVTRLLDDAGVVTLSMKTPRGVAWLFTLPDGGDLPKLNETMVGGLGLLGTRPAGHYQVAPGSMVDAGQDL